MHALKKELQRCRQVFGGKGQPFRRAGTARGLHGDHPRHLGLRHREHPVAVVDEIGAGEKGQVVEVGAGLQAMAIDSGQMPPVERAIGHGVVDYLPQGSHLQFFQFFAVERVGHSKPPGDECIDGGFGQVCMCFYRRSPVQAPAAPGGQIEAAKRDKAAVRLGDMDAAAAQALEIKVPTILEGHGRDGEGVAGRPAEEAVQVIGGFAGRGTVAMGIAPH